MNLKNIKYQNVKGIKKKQVMENKKNRWGWVIIAAFTARTARDAKNKKKWKKIYQKIGDIDLDDILNKKKDNELYELLKKYK